LSTTLILILVVAGAYLAAHVAFEWLARRFSIISGAEYLLLGILLGPQVTGLMSPSVVGAFGPFITLALGWIGAVVGAQFYLPGLTRIPGVHFRIAFTEALLSLTLVAAAMAGTMVWLFPVSLLEAAVPAIALAAIATASAPTGIAVIQRKVGRRQPVVQQLEVATAIDALIAITAVGILLSVAYMGPDMDPRTPTATEWAVISIAIGVVGGALFHLFLGHEREIDRLFIALSGAIILASGAAAYLRLSPLFPAMIIGFILVNTSANRAEIKEVLSRVERPLYFVLLIFAGAAWQTGPDSWVAPVLIFLVARTAAKLGGSWLAAAFSRATPALGHGWGRALLGQGGLAIAIGLSYRIGEDRPFSEIVFTAAVVSVLLTDFSSARLARSVLGPFLSRRGRRVAYAQDEPAPEPGSGPGPGPEPGSDAATGAPADGGPGGESVVNRDGEDGTRSDSDRGSR
jgi:hypothetical protein